MYWNALLLALRAIRRNLLRSFLTVLGVVIGVAAVITMVTVGNGTTAQVSAQIASLGSNLLIIRPGQRLGPGSGGGGKAFEVADAEAIAREVANVAVAAPVASRGVTAILGDQNWSTTLTGSDNGFFAAKGWAVSAGRLFSPSELRAGRAVCVIGATLKKELFADGDPLGTRLRLEKLACQVIGVLTEKGHSAFGTDQDDVVVIPLRAFQRRVAGNTEVRNIFVSVRDGASTGAAQKAVEVLLRERRHIAPGEDDDFSVRDMKEIAQTLSGTTRALTALLGSVAGVSLLVGGIGIMNIMLVSVTERTREIGVRLAIGALEREVLTQFLVEAVVLSLLGGLLGILLALSASALITRLMGVPLLLEPAVILTALLFSIAVGVVFGYFPARRAARLDPIEALRHE